MRPGNRLTFSALLIFAVFAVPCAAPAQPAPAPWRSDLYPADWKPTRLESAHFYRDKLIQDFSRAGYHSSDIAIPRIEGPVFNAALPPFSADPTGSRDSTGALQAAIDAASAAGGGVVWLPRGIYRVQPPPDRTEALLVSYSRIVLRGEGPAATRLLNTSHSMRSCAVVRFAGPAAAAFTADLGTATLLTRDLPGPATRLPVADLRPFRVGAWILVRADMTDAWVTEHREPGWLGRGADIGGFAYPRRIVAIDRLARAVVIDTPTRYALFRRDRARIVIPPAQPLVECGIEDLALGNLQHPGAGWKENDYTNPANASYDTHDSWLLNFDRMRDSWVRNVHSFRPPANTLDVHLLSNALRLRDTRGITVEDCHFQRPQFGGGGGNGYMFRIHSSGENLLLRCTAERSRHGFVFSHPASAGNVLHACLDRDTGHQAGDTGAQRTNGRGSDHHAWFSHSNLVDSCTADSSWFEANFRPWGAETKHNLTAAHSVFWNTTGTGAYGPVVASEQSRYGYVIGTGGSRSKISRPRYGGDKCDPPDHIEGEGLGASLQPPSLYLDQLARRRSTTGK